MLIGIAAATTLEIQPTIEFLQQEPPRDLWNFEVRITGVGTLAAAYQITDFIRQRSPDYLLQAGVAGSFSERFLPGSVMLIREEMLGDLGVQEKEGFKDIFDLNLSSPSSKPYHNGRLINRHIKNWENLGLPVASGITVNEITTLPARISLLKHKYQCEVESMEGAALHYVCLLENIPFIQIRSISNHVGERNKKKWEMEKAIKNLNLALIGILKKLTT